MYLFQFPSPSIAAPSLKVTVMSKKGKGKGKTGGDSEKSELEQTKENCEKLLKDKPDGIHFAAFWDVYRKKYGNFPDHKALGLIKRSDFFDKFGGSVVVVGTFHKDKVVKLASQGVQKRNAEQAVGEVSSKSSKPQKAHSSAKEKETKEEDKNMADRNPHQMYRSSPYNQQPRHHGQPAPPGTTDPPLIAGYAGQSHWPQVGHRQQAVAPEAMQVSQGMTMSLGGGAPAFYQAFGQRQGDGSGARPKDIQHAGPSHGNRGYRDQQRDQRSGHPQRHYQSYSGGSGGGGSGGHVFANKDQVNAVAVDCIERLSEAKEYVSMERIEKLLLQHYNVERLGDMGIRQLEHLDSVRELLMRQRKVNAYIQAFGKVSFTIHL